EVVVRKNPEDKPRTVQLKAVSGPDDNGKPCLTVKKFGEDSGGRNISRHELRGREPHISLTVGWDGRLETDFAEVVDEETYEYDEEPLFCAGCEYQELPSVDALAEAIAPYAEIPPSLCGELRRDRICEETEPDTED